MHFCEMVEMPDKSIYKVDRLLGRSNSNAKLAKSNKAGSQFLTIGLSLAPAKASGFNLCTSASGACIRDCIFTAGQAQIFRAIPLARIAKSRLLRIAPSIFIPQLMTEIRNAEKMASRKNLRLACRLNVFSDVKWEDEFPQIYDTFRGIQFYDYTKHYDRMRSYLNGNLPKNLHLTFSWSGRNEDQCIEILNRGGNVAIPFNVKYFGEKRQPLPKKFLGRPIIDGDITDLRFLDRKARKGRAGYIIGLRAKGKGKKDLKSGFIVQPTDDGVIW